jgi:hypothetical protein
MTVTKILMHCAAALAMVLAAGSVGRVAIILSSVAQAQTTFFDDFDDGDSTDGVPTEWVPVEFFSAASYGVQGGDYVLSTPGGQPVVSAGVAYANINALFNTSVRAQVRQIQGTGSIALLARANIDALTAYQAGIDSEGTVYLARNSGPVVPPILATAPTDLNTVDEDVVLQLDAIGNELSLYAWRIGDAKPAIPLLSVTDHAYTSGVPGLLISGGIAHSAAYRYVHVANASIPEPSAAVLSAIFLAGVFACRWRCTR